MNPTLVLAALCALLVHQASGHSCSSGSGNSCEAETRKKDCGGLVEEPESSEEEELPPATVATPPPGECVCTPAPGSGSGSGEFHSKCELIEAFYNISIILSVEHQTIWLEFVRSIEINILADFSLSNEEKIVLIAYELKAFFKVHYEIKIEIGYELIGEWGYVVDLETVAIDIQSDKCESLIVLDEEDDCDVFEGLRNATEGDSEKSAAVVILIEELKAIFIDVSITYEMKLTLVFEKFEAFFELHADWEEYFLGCEIEGFGTFEMFLDVCHVYHRITHVDVVLGGSASECVIIQSLEEAFLNESFSLSTRSQIQQIKIKLEGYFASETDVYLRMSYVSAQLYQFYKLFDIKTLKDIDRISLGEWGTIFDFRFCSSFYKNHGWDFGAATTLEASTAEPADLSCVKRGPLITIGSGCNCTTLTDSINAAFQTWNRTDRGNFNPYKKRIETLIWGNEYPATTDKIAQIVTVFNGCSTPGTSTYTLVMGTEITGWGNVKKFTDCQNAPNHD